MKFSNLLAFFIFAISLSGLSIASDYNNGEEQRKKLLSVLALDEYPIEIEGNLVIQSKPIDTQYKSIPGEYNVNSFIYYSDARFPEFGFFINGDYPINLIAVSLIKNNKNDSFNFLLPMRLIVDEHGYFQKKGSFVMRLTVNEVRKLNDFGIQIADYIDKLYKEKAITFKAWMSLHRDPNIPVKINYQLKSIRFPNSEYIPDQQIRSKL